VWVSVLASVGLFRVELIVVAVGWQVWDSWMVDAVLLVLELGAAAVGWQVWVSLVVSVAGVGGVLCDLVFSWASWGDMCGFRHW
jgi:hypothetical protein